MSDLSAGAEALDHLDERVQRLGATLVELGWDQALHRLADEMPDAREQLRHVGSMTETAANTVLNLVDATQPACQLAARERAALARHIDTLLATPDLSPDEARAALADAAAQLHAGTQLAAAVADTLTSIMLAQDFQDLSGQVINKVVGIISHTEEQLQRLLAQSEGRASPAAPPTLLAGPQVPAKAVAQSEVDDLLASMGF